MSTLLSSLKNCSISLYPDQEVFVNSILSALKTNKRVIGCLPTGGGKTRVAAKLVRLGMSGNRKVCFVVPRITLLEQTRKAFCDLGIMDSQIIQGGRAYDPNHNLFIASIDTLIRRDYLDMDLFIIDECHKRKEKVCSWMKTKRAKWLGLTATPYPEWLEDSYDTLVAGPSYEWMIENKRLAPYDVYAPSVPDLRGVSSTITAYGKDYKEAELVKIMGNNKLLGDIVKNWIQHGKNKLTITLCINKNHARSLKNEFIKHHVPAELILAETPLKEREEILERSKKGTTKILLSVDCLTEGVDLPECDTLINARPTKSLTRFVQGVGRVLRYQENKKATIFDHSGSFIKPDLGFLEDLPLPYLGMYSTKKNSTKKQPLKKKVSKTICPKCSRVRASGEIICQNCGHKKQVEKPKIDAKKDLTKLNRNDIKKNVELLKQFYCELEAIRKTRTRADGKTYHWKWSNHLFLEYSGQPAPKDFIKAAKKFTGKPSQTTKEIVYSMEVARREKYFRRSM